MSHSDKLVATMVVDLGVNIDHATEIIELFDEIDWKRHVEVLRLRRKARKLLGTNLGERVFGLLRPEGIALGKNA